MGIPELIERLEPTAVFVHGTMEHRLFRNLAGKTECVPIETRWTGRGCGAT